MTKSNKLISNRLAGRLVNEGFLDARGGWTDATIREACQEFYLYCIEILPAEVAPKMKVMEPRPSEPRWMRMVNFGQSSLEELSKFCGETRQEPVKCFGVWVTKDVYNELRDTAVSRQLRPKAN